MLLSPDSDDQVELQKGQESERTLPDTPEGGWGRNLLLGTGKGILMGVGSTAQILGKN